MSARDRAEDRAPTSPRLPAVWPLSILAIAAGLYLATAARDVLIGDTAEFLAAALSGGVPHPSGYPLLVLLGRVFAWLPVGDLPFRANLVGVASSAGTASLVFLTSRRLGASPLAAAVGALVLVGHPLFWEWSLSLEAFPLNNVLAASVVYFLVRWHAESDHVGPLLLAALCGALGVANHLTIVCLVPAAALMLWRHRHTLLSRPGWVVALIAVSVVGLLPYAYLPWAASHDPYLNWGDIRSATSLVSHVLRNDYGTLNLAPAGGPSGSPSRSLLALGASFTWLEAALMIVGAVTAYRQVRWYLWGTLLTFALAGPVFAMIANIDPATPPLLWVLRRFFVLPHVVLAPLAALGVMALFEAARLVARPAQAACVAVALGVIAIIGVGAAGRYRERDQHDNHLARTYAEDILASLEPRAVLIASGEGVVYPLAYLQAVEHRRPDVTIIALGLFRHFDWYLSELRRRDANLRVPFEHYDPSLRSSSLEALVNANSGRSFAFVGEAQDDGSLHDYWFYQRGLVSQVEPGRHTVSLEGMVAENERLLHLYRVPNAAAIKRQSGEVTILATYARAVSQVGDQCALRYRHAEAAAWYRRALAIDPDLPEARAGLAKLARTAPGS